MSGRHYEELWREGVTELVGLLDAEHPEDRVAAPKTLDDWSRIYVRYVVTYQKLCSAHDGLAHPQKRASLRRTLEVCLGRLLELRGWLAQLGGGVDVLDLSTQLAALHLTPDALDMPIPAYFREARAGALAARAAAAASAAQAEAALVGGAAAGGEQQAGEAEAGDAGWAQEAAAGEDLGPRGAAEDEQQQQQQQQAAAEQQVVITTAAAASAAASSSPNRGDGQQPAEAAEELSEEDAAQQTRRSAAAVVVQAAARGWLARRAAAAARRAELEFLGMAPPADGARSAALAAKMAAVGERRRALRAERAAELDSALVSIKAGVKQREGWSMKERIRDKLNTWFLGSRDPETGQYADLPDAAKGGSAAIVNPPPPEPTPEEAAAAAARAAKEGGAKGGAKAGAKAGKGGKGGKGGAPEAPPMSFAFLEGLRGAVQHYLDVWGEYEEADPTLALLPPELRDLPQPKLNTESYDADMVTAEVRPVVLEEVRLEADEEMRRLIRSIKETLKSGKEGRKKKVKKGGKDGKGKKDGKGGGKGGGKDANGGQDAKGGKKGGKKDGKGEAAPPLPKKKRKDLTAGRSVESIFAELAGAGLVHTPAPLTLSDYLGGERLAPAEAAPEAAPAAAKPKVGGKKANAAPAKAAAPPAGKGGKGKGAAEAAAGQAAHAAYPEPSLAQARQAVAAACVLPLGAHDALAKLQAPHTVLLYGPPGSGKSLLAQAVAHQAGATLFDLSPAAIDGKYPGKASALLVNMVFKAARALAPSVVLIEGVEGVMVTDRTRARAFAGASGEPPNRIKKQLVVEVADLEPGDGVLVLCTSSQPQACVKKDERALRTFVQRYIQLPLPDYGSRQTLLAAFAQHEKLELGSNLLSLLGQVTTGLTAGQLRSFVQQLAAAAERSAASAAADRALRRRAKGAAEAEPASLQAEAAAQDVGQQPDAAAAQARQQEGWSGSAAPPTAQQPRQEPPSLEQLAVGLLPALMPLSKEDAAAVREWTARVHSPLPPEEAPKDGKKGGKKK
ncbi:IQ and AAA domain-containing 1 [Micractinium conductrix]|uniref:IQ and AAA domain-containing 1 n=1 Tax=Micractinium conductrix TaxID=554055 RepID=A0A2P6V9A0_9CHLO|nr:IQ and AAA domain-containing 1 [Micractinium conductrix]|eukprot:PSC70654.1 IQ and AAA domain-containing 1 [Micractinium conductrix]